MSPQALAIMAAIQGGFAIAPDVIAFAASVKRFITDLFTNSVITKADQDALNTRVTELCVQRLRGELPPHWQVEPDPV